MKTIAILTDQTFHSINVNDPESVVAPTGADDVTQELFFYDKYNEDAWKFMHNESELILRESYFQRIKDLGLSIKADFSKTKVRKMKGDPMKVLNSPNSGSGASKQIVEAFDPSKLEINSRKLKDMNFDPRLKVPIKTGTYFDEFCSRKGGVMPGTNTMVTGDPGVGKSSNLMDIQTNINKNQPNKRVLYVSGEMKPIDVDEFKEFYPGLDDADFFYVGDYVADPDNDIPVWQALSAILHKGWDLVILDSLVEVQGMVADELGLTGKKAEKWILDLMAQHNRGYNQRETFTAFLAIQQMNKSGNYAGSKRLEHMTDAYLQLKWCKDEKGRRYMEYSKNRKGKEKVRLYYAFGDGDGIQYAESRHKKELKTMDIQQSAGFTDAEEMDEDEMFQFFEKLEEQAMERQQAAV